MAVEYSWSLVVAGSRGKPPAELLLTADFEPNMQLWVVLVVVVVVNVDAIELSGGAAAGFGSGPFVSEK